ncbi:MAG: AraC family transcriptional regulator [Oscillospiraceae bacterium]|nr:AraC family transcriptional regulator [Oscillospiraceae bacterium]
MYIRYEDQDNRMFRFIKTRNLNIESHLHKHIEILCVLDGEIDVTADFHKRTLTKGDAAFFFPNCIHSYTTESVSSIYILIADLNLTGDFTGKLLKYSPRDPFISSENLHPDVLYCMDTIHADSNEFYTMDADTNYNKLAAKGYIQAIIARLLSVMELHKSEVPVDIGLNKRVLSYIMENFSDSEMSLKRMADDLNVSIPVLCNVFSKKIGINYHDYLNICRVRHAQQLLFDTELTMPSIACESGFNNTRTFDRVFKKITGLTPRAYRQSATEI